MTTYLDVPSDVWLIILTLIIVIETLALILLTNKLLKVTIALVHGKVSNTLDLRQPPVFPQKIIKPLQKSCALVSKSQ